MSQYPPAADALSARIVGERLRLVERVGKIGIWEWEIATNQLSWTDQVYRIHGKDPATFTPSYEGWQESIHPEDRRIVLAAVGESLQWGKEYFVEFRVVWPDGSTHWITTQGGVEYDGAGNPARMIGMTFDVTDRKNAEEALRRKEQELRIITDSLPFRISYVDREQHYTFMNRAYERLLDRPVAQMVGRHMREVLGDEFYNRLKDHVERALSGEEVVFDLAYPFKGNPPPEARVNYIPDRDRSGQVRGFFVLVQDLTGQRMAEEALRRAERLASAGRLAATIAHEVNNPLEAVTNLVFLAREHPAAGGVVREYLLAAEEELQRVHHLVNQTLGFYRELSRPGEVEFRRLVEHVVSMQLPKIQARRAVVETHVDPEARVRGMAGELNQVFANLLANALDAISNGGKIRIRVRARVAGVRVSISDNGTGIPRNHYSRLFEPFFTTKDDVGTGLGLWVAREIVQKHGGVLMLRSQTSGPRQGTLFSFYLPAKAKAVSNSAHKQAIVGF